MDTSKQVFGGQWTEEKLEIIKRYLEAYTTALKTRDFKLWYIDAFAGTGEVWIRNQNDKSDEQVVKFLEGSAKIACGVQQKRFDKLIFIENDAAKAERLRQLEPMSGRVEVQEGDANEVLKRLCEITDWSDKRAVVFLDPFSLQVKWETVEAIAKTKAIDVWILFPVSTVTRIMPKKGLPEGRLAERLTLVFGDESWKDLYHIPYQTGLFGETETSVVRDSGVDQITELYEKKLCVVFAKVASNSRPLKNSRNTTLFELMFAVSNPSGAAIGLALKIANHILQKI